MQKKSTTRKAHKTREPLTRDRIVDAALQLVDSEGLEGLSMRRLGTALRVEAMAIYHHFANKGEVLDGVLERLVDEVVLPPKGSMPALERLRHFARSYRQMALRHPNAFILVPSRRFSTDRNFARYENLLETFQELGFDGALSARYFRTLAYFCSGAGLADIASRAQQPDATPVVMEDFNNSQYPLVIAVVPHLRAGNLDAVFEFGLEIIMQAMTRDSEAALKQRS